MRFFFHLNRGLFPAPWVQARISSAMLSSLVFDLLHVLLFPFQSLIAFYVTRDLRMNEYSKAIVSFFVPFLFQLSLSILSFLTTSISLRADTGDHILLQLRRVHSPAGPTLRTKPVKQTFTLQSSVFPHILCICTRWPGDQVEQPPPQVPPHRRRDALGDLGCRGLRPPEPDAQPHVPSRHGHRRCQRARHGKTPAPRTQPEAT